jgi:short-subunit dehydrogenase
MQSLSGKRVLITGASRGLGKELALTFAKEKTKLILNSRSDDLYKVAEQCRALGAACEIIKGDITIEATMDKLAQPVDILINNAGIIFMEEFKDTTDKQIDSVFTIDTIAPIKLTRRIYPKMIAQGSGHIVNIISTAGREGMKNHVIYGAAKFGLSGFSQALQKEAAEHGIKVTAIYPGGMNTNLFDRYDIDKEKLMDPKNTAYIIVELCKLDPNVIPSELVLKRMSFTTSHKN